MIILTNCVEGIVDGKISWFGDANEHDTDREGDFGEDSGGEREEAEKEEVLVQALEMMGIVDISSFRSMVSIRWVEPSDFIGYFMVHKYWVNSHVLDAGSFISASESNTKVIYFWISGCTQFV